MKKLLALLLAVCMCFAACITLASCDKHTHAFKSEWDKDATHHWHVCEGEGCTEVADKAEHTWNEGEITTAATHGADGVKTFTCTACAATKTEAVQGDFTVTAEEWAQAMALENNENYVMTFSSPDMEVTSVAINKNGNKAFSMAGEMYLVNDNGTYYSYYKSYNSGTNSFEYERSEISEDSYNAILSQGLGNMFKFADFTYDEESKSYTAAEISVAPEGTNESMPLTNVSLRFLDKKLVLASFRVTGEGFSDERMQLEITYGNAEAVVLPELLPENQLVVMEDGTYAYWYYDRSGHVVWSPSRYMEITLPNGTTKTLGELNTELRLLYFVEVAENTYVLFDHTATEIPIPPQGEMLTVVDRYTISYPDGTFGIIINAVIFPDGTVKGAGRIIIQVVELPSGEKVYFQGTGNEQQIELPDGTFATVRPEIVNRIVVGYTVELSDGTILESADFTY